MAGASLGAVNITASGTVISASVRVRGLMWRESGAANGSVALRDGGSGGAVVFSFDTDGNDQEHTVMFPGDDYLYFATDVYADLSNVNSLTVLYY